MARPVGAGDADQRRAAHDQRADRLGDLVLAGEIAEGEAMRQHGLVEHSDTALPRLADDRSVGVASRLSLSCILRWKALDGTSRHPE